MKDRLINSFDRGSGKMSGTKKAANVEFTKKSHLSLLINIR